MSLSTEQIKSPETSAEKQQYSFAQRHSLLLVSISPVIANLLGSIFNFLYNHYQIEPVLSEAQFTRFLNFSIIFNSVVFPLGILCWVLPIFGMRNIHKSLLENRTVDKDELLKAQRHAVNLPWWGLLVTGACWLICVPMFPVALLDKSETLPTDIVWHLAASFFIGAMIAITQSFFLIEMVSQRALYPVFFRSSSPADVPGTFPLNLTARGLLWTLAAVVSPILSLVLLLLIPKATNATPMFGVAVAIAGIIFGVMTVWMYGRLVQVPVRLLKKASIQVAKGDLDVKVHLLRADEFGTLIKHFNLMVEGLRDREQLQETFGRHVGKKAAQQILQQDNQLMGVEQVITVMFVDIRNFTEHSSNRSPEEVVTALNVFFRHAVETVESHGGMVNKFLGDGFMALYGIGADTNNHALQAVSAGQALLDILSKSSQELEQAGWPKFQIGIGINTGPAVVGSIGSPKRQEYTAIGDTVNVASRVETLTKKLGHCLLVTDETRQLLPNDIILKPMPPQAVKGKGQELLVYAIDE